MKVNTLTLLFELAHGNPGASVAVENMYHYDRTWASRLYKKMKEMGLTGSKIWVGFKYYKLKIHKFMAGIEFADPKMIRYINKAVRSGGCGNGTEIEK